MQGSEAVMHLNEASVQRAFCAVHDDIVRPHIEEAQTHENKGGLHRDMSRVQSQVVRVQ